MSGLMWADCLPTIVKGLSETDPAGKATYEKNGAAAKERMTALHKWCLEKAKELPKERRILVTSHDAYNYFGRAYGFEVVAIQGVSTVTEASLSDISKMVDFIKAQKVKAIFVESSVSPTTIKRVSKDANVKIGGELFSDAMGAPGQMKENFNVGTYEGMVKYNLTTIVEALK
jgi:manganese/zinc/iron transport system substrate-binding protein